MQWKEHKVKKSIKIYCTTSFFLVNGNEYDFNGKIIFSTLDKKKFLFIDYSDKGKKNYFRAEIFFKNL